jgi:hypothetical protein
VTFRPRQLARAMALISGLMLPCRLLAQVSGQSFEVTPETAHPTVGDTVTVRFRVRLDERDLLFDTVPQPLGALSPGVRILAVDKLARTPDRIFHGKARLAFYRPGRQPIPVFMLPFMRAVKGVQRATLASDSAYVEIDSLLPAGDQQLKDIREVRLSTGPSLTSLIAAGALLAGLLLLAYILRRRRKSLGKAESPDLRNLEVELAPTPYAAAVARLDGIERERWPRRGEVARHYEAIVDVVRGYLEDAEGVPARERTTEELLWELPPHLSEGGLRDRFRDLLDEADLVKFARFTPTPEGAEIFLEQCRIMLRDWERAHTTSPLEANASR